MAITNKKINLEQLDAELGNQGLCADFNNLDKIVIVPAENSSVTEQELEKAIEAHEAKPTAQEIKLLNREQGIAKLKELGFTDVQITALLNG